MSKRTLALIGLLVVLTAALVAIAVSPKQPVTQQTPTPTVMQPSPTPPAETVISLSPNPLTATGGTNTIDVLVNTGTNKLTAIQLELSYDPKIISNVSIKPGSFIEAPFPLLNNIDQANGRISYALGLAPSATAKTGSGVIATISFRAQLPAGQQTEIMVLPKSLVTAQGVVPSVLKSYTGATIVGSTQSAPATTAPVTTISPAQ